MFRWFRFFSRLGTGKLVLIISGLVAATCGSAGFYAGQKWQKGEYFGELQRAVAIEKEAHAQQLRIAQAAWAKEWDMLQLEISQWETQSIVDVQRAVTLEEELQELRIRFNELNKDAIAVDSFGECNLSPDAITLLKRATSGRSDVSDSRASEN